MPKEKKDKSAKGTKAKEGKVKKDGKAAPAVPKAAKKAASPSPKAPEKKSLLGSLVSEVENLVCHTEIGLRAYFISQDRRHHGKPGDEHSDWVEAERQLSAEAKKKKAK